jgi:FAD/FMN-containing dehydrogenase
MGLTGHILEVELRMVRLPSPWIFAESFPVSGIGPFVEALERSGESWPFTVGWIDCLSGGPGRPETGRGIMNRGRWATAEEAPEEAPRPKRRLSVPLTAPGFLLNRFTVGAFNALYFHRTRLWSRDETHGRMSRGIVHPESFFYPLDAIGHWNRLYGPRGFTQYQCVLPKGEGEAQGSTADSTADRARRFLDVLTSSGAASFLCVIKDCGPEGEGVLSFPRPGISIAVDLPVRDDTPELVERLDRRVIEEGGRIYLAKDGFTTAERFREMEGERLEELERLRDRYDPERRIRSAQSVRVLGDPPSR